MTANRQFCVKVVLLLVDVSYLTMNKCKLQIIMHAWKQYHERVPNDWYQLLPPLQFLLISQHALAFLVWEPQLFNVFLLNCVRHFYA